LIGVIWRLEANAAAATVQLQLRTGDL